MPQAGPSLPGSAAGWTNSSNALAEDGAVASAQYNPQTPALVLGSFGFSIGAGDVVEGIEFSVKLRRVGAPTANAYAYLLNGGTPKGSAKSLGALGTVLDTVTVGGPNDTWGASWTPAEIAALQVVIYAEATDTGSNDAEVDVGRVTVYHADRTPDAFAFIDQTNVTPSSTVTSEGVTITGLNTSVPATVTEGHQYNYSGTGWVTSTGQAFLVSNGAVIQVRHTASASYSTAVSTTLWVNGVTDNFTSTTIAADTTPNAFSFNDVTGVEPSTSYTSNQITVSGINAPANISITGGEYRINGGAWTSSAGTVNNGASVELRVTSSASYSTGVTATLTIGGVSDGWTVTTRAADTTPNQFAFVDQSNVTPSTVATSNTVSITGIEAAANVSFASSGIGSSFEYQKNGGSWTALGATTVNNNDTLAVRFTVGAGPAETGNIQVTVGGVTDTFSATTTADTLPDAFSFADKVNVIPGDPGPHDSGEAQITGIGTTVTATADHCNVADSVSTPISAGYVDPNTSVANNDYVEARTKTTAPIPKCGQQTLVLTVRVGTGSATWTIKTKPGMPAGQTAF